MDTADTVDYFHFSLTAKRDVGVRIRRLDYNADLYIEDNDGTVIASSENTGDSKEVVNVTLAANDAGEHYYVRVEGKEDGTNDYQFRYFAEAPPNVTATGAPTITGTVQVRETLTAGTSAIADGNGLSGTTFAYQWVRSANGTGTDVAGATSSTFLLTQDELDHTVTVRVSFTDDAGYTETVISAATAAVARQPNVSPSGLPTIRGVVAVGKTLSADTSGITDGNGLTGASFTYQWVRTIASVDADIPGATGSTHTITASDAGAAFKVKVAFTDDAGYSESVTSNSTAPVAEEASSNQQARAITPRTDVTLVSNTSETHDSDGSLNGFDHAQKFTTGASSAGYTLRSVGVVISGTTPNVANITASINEINADDEPGTSLGTLGAPTSSSGIYTFSNTTGIDLAASTSYFVMLDVTGAASGNLSNAVSGNQTSSYGWTIANGSIYRDRGTVGSWTDYGSPKRIVIIGAVKGNTNVAAEGTPTITGAAQAGKTLTATVGTIADDDGLPTFPDGYTFQWVRVDADGSSNETNIGSDSDTYTLVTADVGKKIRLKVSFTDNGGTTEGPLTSDAYPSYANVMAAKGTCPTGNDWCETLTLGYVPVTHAGELIEQIGYSNTGGWGELNSADFTHGGTNYPVESLVLRRVTTVSTNVITDAELTIAMKSAELPDGTVLNLGGQAFTVDADSDTTQLAQELWNLLDLGLSFNWAEGGEVAVSANLPPGLDTAIVDGASLVLTYHEDLDTGSVPAASAYSVVVDGGAGTAPSGVSVSGKTVTLTLASAVGSGQVVTVTYTAPASNPLQDASGLAAVPLTGQAVTNNTGNNLAGGAPTISGTAQSGHTLTANTSAITDADGLNNVDYDYQWIRVDPTEALMPSP